MSRTRPWPVPPDGALHVIGDTHFGSESIVPDRLAVWAEDLAKPSGLPVPVAHVQLGDCTEGGLADQRNDFLDFFNANMVAPWHPVLGNHDYWNHPGQEGAGPDPIAQAFGMPAANYVVDYDAFRLIFTAPDWIHPNLTDMVPFTADRLNWIDAQLAGAETCFVLCHWPLYETVGTGAGTDQYRSTDGAFYALDSSDIRAVLADNPSAKAWISGHTHSPLSAPRLVFPEVIGGHTVVSINSSAIAYVRKNKAPTSPICSLYLTVSPGRLDVRFRDHGAGQWVGAGPANHHLWSADI